MGCTYSAPRYIDSSNNKPRLVYRDSSETTDNISKNNLTNNNKSAYGYKWK